AGAWYAGRLRVQTGESPPSASIASGSITYGWSWGLGRPDSTRSSSDHGSAGLFHPMGQPPTTGPDPGPVLVIAGLHGPPVSGQGQEQGPPVGEADLEPGHAAGLLRRPPALLHRPGPGPPGDRHRRLLPDGEPGRG